MITYKQYKNKITGRIIEAYINYEWGETNFSIKHGVTMEKEEFLRHYEPINF